MKPEATHLNRVFAPDRATSPDESPQWLFETVFDAHPSGAVILDESGTILFVNKAWRSLADQSGLASWSYGVGEKYLAIGPAVLGEGMLEIATVCAGLRRLIAGEQAKVCLEFAGPGTAAQRCFQVRAIRLYPSVADGSCRMLVVHDEVARTRQMEEVLGSREELNRVVRILQTEKQQAEVRLRELSRHLINSQENERRRIARELHDDLNQRMALLSIELEQLGQRLPRSAEELRQRTREISTRAQEISTDIHRLSYQLHPSKLDTLGLVAAIRGLCHDFSKRRVLDVEFSNRQIPSVIPKDVALCLFRIAQEALSNVIKHSNARAAKVELIGNSTGLQLRVSDAGVGFEVKEVRGGIGLVSMRERLRLVGGEFSIESEAGHGTQITAWAPLTVTGSSK